LSSIHYFKEVRNYYYELSIILTSYTSCFVGVLIVTGVARAIAVGTVAIGERIKTIGISRAAIANDP
jgi:uncharacterized membrane protein (DUF485 family)